MISLRQLGLTSMPKYSRAVLLSLILSSLMRAGMASTSDDLMITSLKPGSNTTACASLVKTGMSTIPEDLKQMVANKGIRVVITPSILYDQPELANEKPRGFIDGGTSYLNAAGLFQSDKNRILIPERASWRNSNAQAQGSYLLKVIRHEFGHAVDYAMGQTTSKEPYIEAFSGDADRLTNSQRTEFNYYVQGGGEGGRSELFAELFNVMCTPRSQWDNESRQLYAAFPHVVAYMQGLAPALARPVDTAAAATSQALPARAPSSAASGGTARALSPQANACLSKALPYMNARNYKEAMPLVMLAVKNDPANATVYMYRAGIYMGLRQFSQAIADYSKAIEIEPNNASAYRARATAYQWTGQNAKAKADQEQASSLGSN